MRFKIHLGVVRGSVLPINYQYPISSWIYKSINRADSEFARLLHEKGYLGFKEGRPFKFFTFSKLDIPERDVYEDRLIIKSSEVYLEVSFLIEQAVEKFITGIFQHQHVGIGDKRSNVDFEVLGIEANPIKVCSDEVNITTHSPIVISQPEVLNGKLRARYLSPKDPDYKKYFLQNLIRKSESYSAYTGYAINPNWLKVMDWELLHGRVKSKMQIIKAETAQQTKVRGYEYNFKLKAPEPLIEIGLASGFGEKNSLGFGCSDII
jgi:CRISPR-associated endoribonuclease Cas6